MAKKNGVKENVKKTSEEEKLQELESGVNAEELEIASEEDIKKALTESISFTGTQKEITEKIDFAAFAICNHYDYDEKEGLYISPHGNFFIHNDVENETRHVGIEELYDEYFMQKYINDLVKSFNNPTYGSSSDPELKYYYFEFDSKLLGLNKPYDLKIGVEKSENGIEKFFIEGYDRNDGTIYDNVEEELSEPYSKHFSFNNEYLKNEINEYLSRSFPEYDRVSIKIPDSIFEVKNVLSKEAFDNLKTRYDNETKNDKAQTAVFEVSLKSADKSDIYLYYDFRGKPNFLYGFENPSESNGNNYYSFTNPDNYNYKALLKKYPNLEEQVFNAINIDIKKQLCKFFTGMKNSQLTGEKQSFSETFETCKADMFGKQYIENPSEVFNTLWDSSDFMMLENFNFGIFSPNHYDEIYPSSDGAEYRWTISDAATDAIIFGRAQSKEDVQIAINKQIGECSVELNKLDKINDMIIDSRIDNARNIILSKYMDSEVAAISRKDTERAINNYGLQEIIKNTLSNIKFNYEMSGSFVTTEFYDHGNKTLFCDYSFTDIEALIKGYDALAYGKESLSFQRPDALQLKEAFENGDLEFDDILKGYAVFDGLNGEKVPEHICRIDDMMVFDSDNEAAQQWAADNRSSLLVNGVDICIAGSDKQYLDFIDTPENRELLKDNLLDKPLADKFDFSGFSEEQFNKFKEELLSGKEVHDYKGTVKIGSVDIEIVHNEADGFIDTNLYVLGEDTGYSDEAFIPYSHYDGNQFAYQMITDNTYEEFKANFKAWFIHDLFELEMSDSETIAREVSRPNVDWKDFSQANELFRKKLEKELLDKNIILPEEKFNWKEFSKEDFNSLKNDLKYNSYHDGHVYGSIHLGSISIDLTMRNKGEIDVDTYILGEEGIGGEIELDDAVIPYSEGILFTLPYAHIENLNFNDFKKWMQNYIVNEVLRSEDSKELLKEISRPTIDWDNKAECCELYSLKLGEKLNDVFNRNPLSMNIEDKNEALKLIDMGANAKEVLLNAAADANIFENCHWFMQNIPENDLKEYFSDKEFAQQMFDKAKESVTHDEEILADVSDIGYSGFKEIADICGRGEEAEEYYKELKEKHPELTELENKKNTQEEITMNENESVEQIEEKLDKELLKLLNKLDGLRIDSDKENKYARLSVLIPDSELKNLELFSDRARMNPGEGLKMFICNDYLHSTEARFHIDLFEHKNPSYGGTDIGVRTENLKGHISIGESPLPVNDPSVYKSFDIYVPGLREKEQLNNKFFLYANKDIIIEKTIEACKQRQEELRQEKEKKLEEKQKYENNVNDIAGSLGLTENHSTAKEKKLSFTDDIDKMWDFATISKDDFLLSYSYVSEEEYDSTAAELKNKNLSAFQVVENLLEKGKKFSAEEAEMSYIADKIVQQAYESSASGFNVYLGFDAIANLIGKDVQWITDHLDELAEELETHNDELLLDFNGEDNITFKEEEIDFKFCSVGEDANILFKKCNDGRWIRKTDEELQHELNEEEEERFVNANIPQTAEVSITDTDYEVISNIADQNVISELNSNPVSSDSARLYLALKKNITEIIESHPKDFLQGNLNPENFNWKDDINWNSFESVSRLWDYLGKHESNCESFTNELFKSVYFEKENQVKRDFLSCIENVTVEDIYKNKDRTELDSVRFTMRISKDFAFLKQGMSYWAYDSSELDEHSVYITATVSKNNKTSTPDWKFEFTDSVGETASVVSLNDYFQDSFIIPFTSAIKANCENEYKHVHGNIDIQHAVNSNVPVARAYSTDTNDVEAFSLILDELLFKQQFTTGSIAIDKSELLDDIRNSASDILEYCEYNNIQFYSGTDSKLYYLDISEDYNGESIECKTLYDVFSETKDSADAAKYYQYDVYTPESFERIETVFNTLEMLKENQKIESQVPGITQEDIDICSGYDIDFSKKENQQTLLELKNIFINTLDKFPDTTVSDLENAVYHCTEESRWSDLGKLLAQGSDNSIRFMFAENMIKHVTSESHDDNLSPKTAAEKGIEDIIKEEVNLDPVSMAGEKFIFELQKNITSYKNNPWVTTKIILDELKKNDPEEYKNVSLFFKKKKLRSKADYENFFEQSIGSRKVCSISTEKKEPEISKNKPGKEDPDYTR